MKFWSKVLGTMNTHITVRTCCSTTVLDVKIRHLMLRGDWRQTPILRHLGRLLLLHLFWGKELTHPENDTFTMIVFTFFTFTQLFLLCVSPITPKIWGKKFSVSFEEYVDGYNYQGQQWLSNLKLSTTFWKYDILETIESGSISEGGRKIERVIVVDKN